MTEKSLWNASLLKPIRKVPSPRPTTEETFSICYIGSGELAWTWARERADLPPHIPNYLFFLINPLLFSMKSIIFLYTFIYHI